MPTTKEIQDRLRQLLAELATMPVLTWLKEEKEAPSDISDTISLMLEAQTGLMSEIDLFIGSVESGGVRYDRSNDPDLADLPEGDEPPGEGPVGRKGSPAVESEP
jgi:hypothetical protein